MIEHPNLEAIEEAYKEAREDLQRAESQLRMAQAAVTAAEERFRMRAEAYSEALRAGLTGSKDGS